MKGYNRVILIGNLTRDPEVRFTPKGTPVGKFGMAVNRSWKDQNGQTKEEVTFVDIDCFGKSAQTIQQYLKKGSPIAIEGRLKLDQWDDKQTGQKRQRLGVVMEGFTFLGGGQQQGQPASRHASAPEPEAPAEDGPPAAPDDDVPF